MANPADTQAAESEASIGSHEKANNGYGQNGYQGPSSDLPGQSTRMNRDFGLAADPVVDAARAAYGEGANWQTRTVSAEPYAPAHGQKARDNKSAFPTANVRRSSVPANPKSFQR